MARPGSVTSQRGRAGLVGIGQQHDEFLAAVTAGEIDAADRLADAHGEFAQHVVAGVVAEAVVDRLEVIDVDDGQPAPGIGLVVAAVGPVRAVRALGADLGRQVGHAHELLVKRLAVAQARERIALVLVEQGAQVVLLGRADGAVAHPPAHHHHGAPPHSHGGYTPADGSAPAPEGCCVIA